MVKTTGMTMQQKRETTAKLLEKHGFYSEAKDVRTDNVDMLNLNLAMKK